MQESTTTVRDDEIRTIGGPAPRAETQMDPDTQDADTDGTDADTDATDSDTDSTDAGDTDTTDAS